MLHREIVCFVCIILCMRCWWLKYNVFALNIRSTYFEIRWYMRNNYLFIYSLHPSPICISQIYVMVQIVRLIRKCHVTYLVIRENVPRNTVRVFMWNFRRKWFLIMAIVSTNDIKTWRNFQSRCGIFVQFGRDLRKLCPHFKPIYDEYLQCAKVRYLMPHIVSTVYVEFRRLYYAAFALKVSPTLEYIWNAPCILYFIWISSF